MEDFSVENHGTIVLIRPGSATARRQLKAITPETATWWGGALVVEPRYVQDLVEALGRGEGL